MTECKSYAKLVLSCLCRPSLMKWAIMLIMRGGQILWLKHETSVMVRQLFLVSQSFI